MMGRKAIDETGNRYGRLVVIERAGSVPNGPARWLCKCDCGKEATVKGSDLRRGSTRSCGCLREERVPPITRICQNCGKSFQIERWRLKEPNRGKFCSRECAGCPMGTVNSDFFTEPSPEMAWVLGLLYSDGCFYRGRFSIKSIDKQMLETVRDLMGSSFSIYGGEKTNADNEIWRFEVSASRLSVTPEAWGVVPRKSLRLTYPDSLPDEFAPDFIRGLSDGDGCIRYREDNRRKSSYNREWHLLGTRLLLTEVNKRLPVSASISPYKKIAKLRVYSLGDLIAIRDFLYYDDDLPCLHRKRDTFTKSTSVGVDEKIQVDGFEREWYGLQDVSAYERERHFPSLA